MGQRLERDELGADFVAVTRALALRGVVLAIRAGKGREPLVQAGEALILWQDEDDPYARARALEGGMQEVVGPWMHEAEAVARIIRLADAPQPELHVGDLVIRMVDRIVTRGGRPIPLLAREYALLLHLARKPGQTASRGELLRSVWSLNFDPGTNSVEVHISRLRAKLDRGFVTKMLHTVKGRGYMLRASEEITMPPAPLR